MSAILVLDVVGVMVVVVTCHRQQRRRNLLEGCKGGGRMRNEIAFANWQLLYPASVTSKVIARVADIITLP